MWNIMHQGLCGTFLRIIMYVIHLIIIGAAVVIETTLNVTSNDDCKGSSIH